MFSVAVIAAIIFLITAFSIIIARYFKKNIEYITNISQRIAQGELSMQIDGGRIAGDEIGQLCQATGEILQKLNEYVNYITEITHVLNTMANGDMRITLHNDYKGEFSSNQTGSFGHLLFSKYNTDKYSHFC